MVVKMFELCLDAHLGSEIAFGLEGIEVATVANKAIVCLSPKVRIGVGRYPKVGIRRFCFCRLIEPPSIFKTLQRCLL
ncbi:hypothetical protein D3C73_1284220 [compost metagenome]